MVTVLLPAISTRYSAAGGRRWSPLAANVAITAKVAAAIEAAEAAAREGDAAAVDAANLAAEIEAAEGQAALIR